MHLLPCSSCPTSIPVNSSQAGERATCPECGAKVDVPTLGRLRQLPRTETEAPDRARREVSAARQAGFLILGLLATASLLVAGYCGIRWVLIDVPITTEDHIQQLRDQYGQVEAAVLIREYEQMEEFGLDLGAPYQYQQLQDKKDDWGRNALASACVGGAAAFGALAIALAGRARRPRDGTLGEPSP